MSPDTTSPFSPGVPVPLDFFIGRMEEVKKLQAHAKATSEGKLQVAFMVGERGIGKTSVASFARFVAVRDYNLIGIHVHLGGTLSLEEMARKVFEVLVKVAVSSPWFDKVKSVFGNRIKQVDLFGVGLEFNAAERELTQLVHNFAPALKNVLDRVRPEKTGVMLILDDINGLSKSTEFANWLKSFVDGIATSDDPLPLFLLLVGLEERRQELIELQPSLARMFHLVDLKPWSHTEAGDFYDRSFASVCMSVSRDAREQMVSFSGGLPVLAHEIGDAVFKAALSLNRSEIDSATALSGITTASEIVGHKYLQPQVYTAIRSEAYRGILHKICSEVNLGFRFKRSEIVKHLSESEKRVVDNFLKKMVSLHVIVRETDVGSYRFANQLHHLYFIMEGSRRETKR